MKNSFLNDYLFFDRWGTFLEVMLITELESPFSRRKKQKILKEQELHITVQEALRLTNRTLLGEEPEPDYSDTSELEPDYDDDDDDVTNSSYDLVAAGTTSASQTQSSDMVRSEVVGDVDDLTPQQVTRTMRRYFDESRRKKRRSARKFFSNADYDRQQYFSEINQDPRKRPPEDNSVIDMVSDADGTMKVTDAENLIHFHMQVDCLYLFSFY